MRKEGQEIRSASMEKNEDELNIYKINAQLFQILSYMSEAERRKLQSTLIANLPKSESRKHLSVLIPNLSVTKSLELLKKLGNWYHSKLAELREHPRESSFIPAECVSDGVSFTDFIQNISNGGVFIQTDADFYIGQQITMTFSLPKVDKDITVSGKVVRFDSQGIGVKFDELLHDI
jgi:hypothetical protein